MSSINELKEDLGFVAGAVRRSEERLPASIFVLWAILVPIGFALADINGDWCGFYWFFVGPAGGVLSWRMGRTAEQKAGQRDVQLGRRYAMHWAISGLAFLMVGLTFGSVRVDWHATIPVFMLVSALAYSLAGVHLHRSFLPAGLIMFAGYFALTLLPLSYIWTTTGLIVSAALLTGALRNRMAA
ncbi:MAG TPA: hypothetical protein VFB36_06915 [Nevskiaceae bacterium]|nr:hypothetical protein [Nevskiaceae bacterium]